MYALVRLLTENETVAYHSGSGTFLFFENAVYSRISGVGPNFPPVKTPTFCLINLDYDKISVNINFMTDTVLMDKTFPVMASSPMPSRYGWRKQRIAVPIVLMPLCERDELKKG